MRSPGRRRPAWPPRPRLSSASIAAFTPLVKNSAAVRMPCLIARALERPWPITQQPFTPSSGAPPYSAGSIRRFTARKAGLRAGRRPSFARVPLELLLDEVDIDSASVSLAFSTTLPVKPSMTTTSTLPVKMSWPSTLPTKLRPRALQHLVDFLGEVVPLGLLLAHAHEADARVGDAGARRGCRRCPSPRTPRGGAPCSWRWRRRRGARCGP